MGSPARAPRARSLSLRANPAPAVVGPSKGPEGPGRRPPRRNLRLEIAASPLRVVDLLNGSEARVLQALLAAGPESERERLRRLGLPRSTFHVARRTIYGQRWVRDVYIPDPRALGFPYVTVAFAQPHAENWAALARGWSQIGVTPLVWASPTATFAVGFHPEAEAARLAAGRLEKSDARETCVVSTLAEPSALPVYFDFEAGWAKYAELPGVFGYPRGLGAADRPYRSSGSPASSHERETMRALIHEAAASNAEGRPHPNSSPLLFPRPIQRMLRDERVQHRIMPDFLHLPPMRRGPIGQMVLFHGELTNGRTAPDLLSALTQEAGVYPFFFAHDRRRVIFASLARVPAAGTEPPLVRTTRPVLATLQDHLHRIAFTREWLDQLQAPVDHDYLRLLDAPGSSAPAVPGVAQDLARRLGLPRLTR